MVENNNLTYVVEDKILAEILGRNNFSTKESAILELVKNAYDAGAQKVTITFKKSNLNGGKMMISITDDGLGMSEKDIRNAWMHVGKSTRGYKDDSTSRIYAGSKGIGRFALARLGKNVQMFSKKNDFQGILWETDWEKSFLSFSDKEVIGTSINIYNLRDKWSSRNIKPLKEYLSKVYFDSQMKIELEYESEEQKNIETETELIWSKPKLGQNYVASLSIEYNSDKRLLKGEIISDEFKEEVVEIVNSPITGMKFSLNVFDHLKREIINLIRTDNEDIDKSSIADEEIEKVLTSLGSFSGKLFFSLLRVTEKDFEKFEYKHKELLNRYEYGVILYRNAFSVDSFEGRRDWLGLSRRVTSSPAAASHLTGSWRVRPVQLSGYILIDKEENKFIEDISNRQGIVENIYYKILIKIIHLGLREFESYRQSIIRPIAEYKDKLLEEIKEEAQSDREAEEIVSKAINDPEKIKDLTKYDFEKIQSQMSIQRKAIEVANDDKNQIELNYRYETQLLNVLATSQLKINSLGHEIHNNRNTIASHPEKILKLLKSENDWLAMSQVRPYSKNIPYLMNRLKEDLDKILDLADNILEESKKEKFELMDYDLEILINKIIEKWRGQYKWVKFIVDIHSTHDVRISFDYMMVIFDNLILNSIQKNEKGASLVICIDLDYNDGILNFDYRDDGLGLDAKYKNNPMKILEAHESTREDGHGLGMWIVNNTVNKLNGKIKQIESKGGFRISGFMEIEEGDRNE